MDVRDGNLHLRARLAGILYLVTTAAALFAEIAVRGQVLVSGHAAETARNILAAEPLYRAGFVADLIAVLAYLAVTYLLYDLFKPVNKRISALAALFSIVGCAVGTAAALGHLAAIVLLQYLPLANAFSHDQIQAMALVALKLRGLLYEVSIVFFAVYCVLVGYLIVRSAFLPKALGVLMVIAGVAYGIDTSTTFLVPTLSNPVLDNVAVLGLVGEGALTIWLIVFGVNESNWMCQAMAAEESSMVRTPSPL